MKCLNKQIEKFSLELTTATRYIDVVKVIEKYCAVAEVNMKYYRDLKRKQTVHGAVAGRSLGMYIPTCHINLFIYSSLL